MIYGVGLDLVEIARIMDTVQRQPRFPERILSEQELERYHNYTTERRRIEFLAGRFAVKEAFSKALGTGIGKKLRLNKFIVKTMHAASLRFRWQVTMYMFPLHIQNIMQQHK